MCSQWYLLFPYNSFKYNESLSFMKYSITMQNGILILPQGISWSTTGGHTGGAEHRCVAQKETTAAEPASATGAFWRFRRHPGASRVAHDMRKTSSAGRTSANMPVVCPKDIRLAQENYSSIQNPLYFKE
jgi:hypothetical protein